MIVSMLFSTQLASAEDGKALTNADYVRVRERPNKDATQVGFLYKNMVVEIKSQTPEAEKVGKDSYHWYEIRSKGASGWVYGKFLTTNAETWDVDTYDAPGDMQWLYTRFGESTWYYNQTMNMQSFSMDDYRNLMRAAENGSEQAWIALRVTILQHLYENPDDANYAYLKKRLHSAEFLKVILSQYGRQVFDLVPYSRDVILAALGNRPDIASSMPAEYWKDREIVRLVAKGSNRCQFVYDILTAFPSDPELEKDLATCRNTVR
jgi:hypothetical protein